MNYSNDPLIYELRSGLSGDEYVSITAPHKIINSKILLSEIPDFNRKVKVTGYSEVVNFNENSALSNTQFTVNYILGEVYFNPSREGVTVTASYYGKGVVKIPLSRIYTELVDGDIVETLEDVVEVAKEGMEKIPSILTVIDNANTAIVNTNAATSATNTARINISNEEANRVIREDARISAETARASAESDRVSAESTRVTKENDRTSKESIRVTAENSRVSAESSRVNTESTRASAETSRDNAETARVSAETGRVSAEESRQTNTSTAITNLNNSVNELKVWENYSNTKSYKVNNKVQYNGSSYTCTANTTGNPPPTLPTTSNTYWQLIAQRGVDGNGSVVSVNGNSPNINGNVTLPVATASTDGLMTKEHVAELEATKTHVDNTTVHVTSSERNIWNTKETTTGAQSKANAAQAEAISVAASDATSKANAVQTNLNTHDNNATKHITAAERTTWNAKASTSLATNETSGLMSSPDKTKLNGIAAGAQVNTVNSVAGRTGVITLSKSDVGLSNVDNIKQATKVEFDAHASSVTEQLSEIVKNKVPAGSIINNDFDLMVQPTRIDVYANSTIAHEPIDLTNERRFTLEVLNFSPYDGSTLIQKVTYLSPNLGTFTRVCTGNVFGDWDRVITNSNSPNILPVTGSYAGDGTTERVITLGFTPSLVLITWGYGGSVVSRGESTSNGFIARKKRDLPDSFEQNIADNGYSYVAFR